jgi:sulfopyruvate decarboxylase TPP-binding subunit
MKLKFGVPCSQLKDRIKDVDVPCTSEEQAMGIAVGCILCGKKPLVYMQNSGLGRIGDICLSLYRPYNIKFPKLLLSVRRYPFHHKFMGEKTNELLDLYGFKKEDIEMVEQVVDDGKGEIVQSKMQRSKSKNKTSRRKPNKKINGE